jgi:hypothetical protein
LDAWGCQAATGTRFQVENGAQHAPIRIMRTFLFPLLATLLLAAPMSMATAQSNWPPPAAGPAMRTVVSYEISAAIISRRLPGEWADAMSEPLLAEMEADEHFASIDIGSALGNGVLIRFDFDDMESYREWNDSPGVQQMLAEIGQAIGYGYSRSSISMRRVAIDTRAMPAAPKRAPVNPPIAPPVKPKATTRAAVQSS